MYINEVSFEMKKKEKRKDRSGNVREDFLLSSEDIRLIEKDEQFKFGKSSYEVLQKRLDECYTKIGHAKRTIAEFETRASILKKLIGQSQSHDDKILFSLCPRCEMIFDPKVDVCSNCGFVEFAVR